DAGRGSGRMARRVGAGPRRRHGDGRTMTDESDVLERVDDGVQWITLNRPDAGNALTPDQRNRIVDLLDRSDSDRAVRAVVIGATGRHFCTGADLSVDHGTTTDDGTVIPGSIMKTLASGSQRLIAAILECRKPVVAAVGGTAAGIGAHLAFACD